MSLLHWLGRHIFDRSCHKLVRLAAKVEALSRAASEQDLIGELSADRTADAALRELADLLVREPAIAKVLDTYPRPGWSKAQRLVDLYWQMIRDGVRQHIGDSYIATWAISDPEFLSVLLKAESDRSSRLPANVIAIEAFRERAITRAEIASVQD